MESLLTSFITNNPHKKPRYLALGVLEKYRELKGTFANGFSNPGKCVN
jgi:hypothetical protein